MADSEFTLTSDDFEPGGTMPRSAAHSLAGGQNVSPSLSWRGAPAGTRSFALVCHDPDAPTEVGFVHWVMFDIDGATTELAAGAGAPDRKPQGSVLGFTDWGESAYGGMAPPPGDDPHHYNFTLYALDVEKLGLDETTTCAKLRFVSRGNVLAKATLTGRFGVPG